MRKVIYSILGLVVIVVIAFLVSPYFIGSSAEETLHNQITIFNKQIPYITISTSDYQKHWFNSNAKVKIAFHPPKGSGLPQDLGKSLTFNAVIKHGPVFKITDSDGKSSFHFGRGALEIKGTSPTFQGNIEAVLSTTNEVDINADIQKLVFHDNNDNSYTLSGLTFATETGADNNKMHTLAISSLVVADKQQAGSATFKNINLNADGHDNHDVWLGNGNFSIASINVVEGVDKPLAQINNFSVRFKNDLSDDKTKLNSSIGLNVESATAMGKTLKPITFKYSINDIDAKAYESLMSTIKELQSNADVQHLSMQQLMLLVKPVFSLIQAGFNFKINKIFVGLPKEIASSPISAHATVTLKPLGNVLDKIMQPILDASSAPGKQREMQMKMMSSLPMLMGSLTKAVEADGQVNIPTSLINMALMQKYSSALARMAAHGMQVSETPQQMAKKAYDYLVAQKMLVPNDNGDADIMKFSFKDGVLLINGQHPAINLPRPRPTPSTSAAPAPSAPAMDMHAKPAELMPESLPHQHQQQEAVPAPKPAAAPPVTAPAADYHHDTTAKPATPSADTKTTTDHTAAN